MTQLTLKTRIIVSIFALLHCALSLSAFAAPRIYGWELEFTNPTVANSGFGEAHAHANDTSDIARERWRQILDQYCRRNRQCWIEEIEGWVSWQINPSESVWSWEIKNYRVKYSDGFWFQLSFDPAVIEVQMHPMTLTQYKSRERQIQNAIFNTAARAGLYPKQESSTHLHIGAEQAFGDNLHLFRNFLVDAINHPEWAFLFSKTPHNAPPLILLPESHYRAFSRLVAAVDSGEIEDISTFVKRVRKSVYSTTYDLRMTGFGEDPVQKFQEWNVERMREKVEPEHRTVEHRSVPAPQNANDLIAITELTDARIAYIKRLGSIKIPLTPYRNSISRPQQVRSFRQYVETSGLPFERYQHFIPNRCSRYLLEK